MPPKLVLLDLLDLIDTRSKREKEFGSERRCASVMAPAWECARRVVVDDALRGMVDIEAPFPMAVV